MVQVKLQPSPEQAAALAATLRACNTAASQVAVVARQSGVYRNYDLRRHVYQAVKDDYRLGAQAAQHVIKKVSDAYRTLRANIRAGRPTWSTATAGGSSMPASRHPIRS